MTTLITEVELQYDGADGVHVELSKRDDGSWPDVTPPGWDGPLEYTLGIAENIGGQWYASAAIQFWRGLPASGGNVAQDVSTQKQCFAFGYGSTCQIAKNWYYDGRWGNLAGYQPKTGELIGVFVVAGNVRGVTDGSQSPVQERSNVVLVPMPDFNGFSPARAAVLRNESALVFANPRPRATSSARRPGTARRAARGEWRTR